MKPIFRGHRRVPAQVGFSLIEIMVGVVIGMIAVLVIFQVYNVAEGFKRNTTAYGEAMQGGLLSTFVLGMELGNAGTGINTAQTDLGWCAPPAPLTGNVSDIANTFRPIPVLIADSPSGNTNFDAFAVTYSVASTLVSSVPFTANAAPGANYQVQSTGGFHPGDLIVGVQAPNTPNTACASSTVTNPPPTPNVEGVVTISQTGTALNFTPSSVLFNMGPCDRAQKVQYSVANNVLLSTPLLNSNKVPAAACGQPVAVPVPSPVASNVVVMKAEYGINTSNSLEQELDTWVQATGGGGWDPTTLLQAPITTINKIKAVRIGVIVQSEQFDKTLGDYNWVLFDCSDANKANCPGRLTGTMAASVTPQGNWRFRKYETIIPLRNSIWNPT
jgi:type IV pilus assembly protein PilW